jgi:hypothetical protein
MSRRLSFALSTALLATVVVTTPAHAAPTITELAGLPGSTYNWAVSINDSGVAVGGSRVGGVNRPVKFNGNGASELVGPAGASTDVKAVNNNGGAVGTTISGGGVTRAIRFNPDGTHAVLSVPFGYEYANGLAISDSGTTYGIAASLDGRQIPVRWRPNGVLTGLKLPEGANWGTVSSASSNGYVTGHVSGPRLATVAVRWNPDGSVTKLQPLAEGAFSVATAVNRHGDVVGTASFGNGEPAYGVRWNADGTMNKFGPDISPMAINDDGAAVGVNVGGSGHVPYLFRKNGDEIELGVPDGADQVSSLDINNAGVIVGSAGLAAYKWIVS